MRIFWDTETHLIKPGLLMPRLVCVSYALDDDTVGLLDRANGLRQMEIWLRDPNHQFYGHHVVYDFGVLAAEDPATFLPLIFKAYDEGRIHDTKIRQQLVDIANGDLKFHSAEDGEEEDLDEGEKAQYILKTQYTLEALAWRLCRLKIEKKDTWRLRYALLDGIPVERWPKDARDYAIGDAVATQAVANEQRRYPARFLVNAKKQHQAAWALHLMSAWGVRTDGEAVAKLDAHLDVELDIAYDILRKVGLVKPETTKRSMKAIRARVAQAFSVLGETPPLTPKGIKAVIAGAGKPVDVSDYISTAADTLKAAAKAGATIPIPKLDELTVLLDEAKLAELATGIPFLDLIILAESGKYSKLKNTYIPILVNGTQYPICASFNCLVETGRTSCSRPNLQNPPRKGGVRDCFIPRGPIWEEIEVPDNYILQPGEEVVK